MQRLTYDEALQKTSSDRLVIGNLFQKIIITCAITSIMTGFVILGGISFLEKVPNKFECRSDSVDVLSARNNNMTHSAAANGTKEHIIPAGEWQ
jgi:hypothetical protein